MSTGASERQNIEIQTLRSKQELQPLYRKWRELFIIYRYSKWTDFYQETNHWGLWTFWDKLWIQISAHGTQNPEITMHSISTHQSIKELTMQIHVLAKTVFIWPSDGLKARRLELQNNQVQSSRHLLRDNALMTFDQKSMQTKTTLSSF